MLVLYKKRKEQKMRRSLILFIFLMIVLLFTACKSSKDGDKSAEKIFFEGRDDSGTLIVLKNKPERIVSTSLGIDEILLEIADSEQIAALTWSSHDEKMSCSAAKAKKYKRLQRSVEGVAACKPDLVIASGNSGTSVEYIQSLRDLGMTVYITNLPRTEEDVKNRIISLGKAIGQKKRAEKLLKDINECLARVDEKVKNISEDKQAVIIAYGYEGPMGYPGGMFDNMCKRAKIRNGAAILDKPRFGTVPKERVIALNPDFIFLPIWETEANQAARFEKALLEDPALQTLKAIKERKLLKIPDAYRYSCSQYAIFGIEVMAKAVYPELFAE